MAAKEHISVMIPVYNAAPWLDACLTSVLAQTMPPDEIILVDDGSTDGSAALCDAWADKDLRVRVIHQQNKGVSAARNAALGAAAGELLLPLDADDWLEPNCIEVLYALMQRQHVPVAACNHWIEQPNHRRLCFTDRQECVLTAEQALAQTLYHGVPDVSCWGKLYRREVLQGLRYPEGKLYEDTWLFADMAQCAGRLAWTPEPLVHYRIRPDSISRDVWRESKLDYIEAVAHLTEPVRSWYPALEAGCIRREAHAAMSVRRYFVDCTPEMKPMRDELARQALKHAGAVLCDPKAPLRDKAALLALRAGPLAYDLLWKLQNKA